MKCDNMVKKKSYKLKTHGCEATQLEAFISPEDENIYFNMIDFYGNERRLTAKPKELLDFILKIVKASTES